MLYLLQDQGAVKDLVVIICLTNNTRLKKYPLCHICNESVNRIQKKTEGELRLKWGKLGGGTEKYIF